VCSSDLDESGAVIHQRIFLPDEEFDDRITMSIVPSFNGIIVPSPDETAALILPEDRGYIKGNKLYRFKFTFLREKGGLPTLKQWGYYDDEIVKTEFKLLEE